MSFAREAHLESSWEDTESSLYGLSVREDVL